MAARAAGLTHAVFVQNAHATVGGVGTIEDEWASLAHAIESLSNPSSPSTSAAAAPSQAKVGLQRPSSSSALRPLMPSNTNIKRASSAHPASRMSGSKSTPALVSGAKKAAAALAWEDPAIGAGGTEPPLEPEADEESVVVEKSISDRGTAQCMVARRAWFRRFPVGKVMLTSPARCAKETALHLAGRLDEAQKLGAVELRNSLQGAPGQNVETMALGAEFLRVCERLAPAEPSSLCEEILKHKSRQEELQAGIFATAPALRTLLDVEGGESAFGVYAESACEELAEAIRGADGFLSQRKTEKNVSYTSVFGHGGYSHAIAYAVAAAAGMGSSELDQMLDYLVGDVDGVLVPLYGAVGKPAIHLRRPQ
jgi:hypothetical protein